MCIRDSSISIAWLLSWMAFFVPGGLGVREVLLASLLGLQFTTLFGAAQALAFRLELLLLETLAFVLALALRPSGPRDREDAQASSAGDEPAAREPAEPVSEA